MLFRRGRLIVIPGILFYCISFTAISVDYDLYFSDPLRSSAAQVVPFDTGSADSWTIALWVQYTQQDEGGVFFTAYSVRYETKLKIFRKFFGIR